MLTLAGIGQFKALQALARDPACGMLVDPAEAPASFEQDGATLYFCSRGCREEFVAARAPVYVADADA